MPKTRPRPYCLSFPIALLVLLLVLLATAVTAGLAFEEEPTSITKEAAGAQTEIALAMGNTDDIYAVWVDARWTPSSGGTAILFTVSDAINRGRAWGDGDPFPMTLESGEQQAPAITVGPDGIVHVVWQERSRPGAVGGDPFWEVMYSRSTDGGLHWSKPLRVSQLNNADNVGPDVAALTGDAAYVAWTIEEHPTSSVALAKVSKANREWVREDFATGEDPWDLNGEVAIGTGANGTLHAVWSSVDLDAMLDQHASQVFFRSASAVDRDSALPAPVPLADDGVNWTNSAPTLAVTKRSGVWVAWVQGPLPSAETGRVTFLADRVVGGTAGDDVRVATLPVSTQGDPSVDAAAGPDDQVSLAISGVGNPSSPPLHAATCSEMSCFGDPLPVVPQGVSVGLNATVVVDSLGNVIVAWDDREDGWCTQRQNSPPGQPELLQPDLYTHESRPEFVWAFSDPDAGAAQSAFDIQYTSTEGSWGSSLGGVVLGVHGRSSRYLATDPIDEGRWYWRVRTRDELGLWSNWSATSSFLVDWTSPVGTVVVNAGAEVTQQRVVVLTLNASDNLEDVAPDMEFQVSSDPDFPDPAMYSWPPPNHQVNQELSPGEGIKVVFFRIFDATGLSHTSMDTIVYNQTPFIIAHTPITSAPYGKALNISCEILMAKGVTATLFYRTVDGDDYKELEMSSNGSVFWGVVPKDDIKLKGLEYYIRARSAAGTVSSPPGKPAEEPYAVDVYETTEQYEPPIYYPVATFIGALVVLIMLFLIWYYRIRE